ncbi:hypothetical protein ACHAXR_006638 [Thalassiosira sp. AJA248-18]
MSNMWPSTTQKRALAYAPKPFAALSFLSSLFIMYYLLVRHPEKRKAMPPESSPWAVGASGTSLTCSIQGFIVITFYLAFPFYYASFSIFACRFECPFVLATCNDFSLNFAILIVFTPDVALKNNFKEENYAWMEKFIHIGAYLFPLILSIVASVNDWINPGLSFCTFVIPGDDCEEHIDPDQDCRHKNESQIIYATASSIILAELTVGTLTIIYLLYKFETIQTDIDAAIGMRQIVEKARKRRLHDVGLQSGLYLLSFWLGYLPSLVEAIVWVITESLNYDLIVFANCIFGCQGFIIMVIYFALQNRSQRVSTVLPGPMLENLTVSQIKASAAMPKKRASGMSSRERFSFHIFDGTPAEDSPWLDYFEDGASGASDVEGTLFEGEDRNSLVASLLTE